MNDTAENGFSVHSWVELLWDDDKPFAEFPFRVITMVNGHIMFTAHCRTNNEAIKQAAKMQPAYLSVHRSKTRKASVGGAL